MQGFSDLTTSFFVFGGGQGSSLIFEQPFLHSKWLLKKDIRRVLWIYILLKNKDFTLLTPKPF